MTATDTVAAPARTLPPIGCNGRGAQASSFAQPVSLTEADIDTQFRLVGEAGAFDYFDRLPGAADLPAFQRCIAEQQLPVHTASWFYALGRDDALLPQKLQLAAEVGAKTHNIMLYWHDGEGRPITNEEVVDFYLRAWDLGMAHGVEPALEYHVNMWSEDPRRIAPVAEAVRRRGIPFWLTLDYSHAIFKIGNAQELAICGLDGDSSAALDPFQPGSFVDQWLDMGIVRWLQVRCAAPNGPRNLWSVQDPANAVAAVPAHSIFPYRAGEPGRGILYPFTKPAPGEWHSPWEAGATAMTREVVRKVLAHHHTHADSPLRWITTEMINLPDYAHNARFSLIGQNAALARFVRESWQAISAAG
ncbi:sugar phosphate isomerase/epimerase [Xenophilus sp. Marseille-Q4582]|uniref:sugar phosphate isomerase/epimerase n=1 Tax=Xenophilus sp. Marseille-Q4582 TaxID=2866600 RepID=UPI001CE47A7F|nr:sugar phosphate isomerase/epimerase [Xenophilus sp. Marseille-Q4582]